MARTRTHGTTTDLPTNKTIMRQMGFWPDDPCPPRRLMKRSDYRLSPAQRTNVNNRLKHAVDQVHGTYTWDYLRLLRRVPADRDLDHLRQAIHWAKLERERLGTRGPNLRNRDFRLWLAENAEATKDYNQRAAEAQLTGTALPDHYPPPTTPLKDIVPVEAKYIEEVVSHVIANRLKRRKVLNMDYFWQHTGDEPVTDNGIPGTSTIPANPAAATAASARLRRSTRANRSPRAAGGATAATANPNAGLNTAPATLSSSFAHPPIGSDVAPLPHGSVNAPPHIISNNAPPHNTLNNAALPPLFHSATPHNTSNDTLLAIASRTRAALSQLSSSADVPLISDDQPYHVQPVLGSSVQYYGNASHNLQPQPTIAGGNHGQYEGLIHGDPWMGAPAPEVPDVDHSFAKRMKYPNPLKVDNESTTPYYNSKKRALSPEDDDAEYGETQAKKPCLGFDSVIDQDSGFFEPYDGNPQHHTCIDPALLDTPSMETHSLDTQSTYTQSLHDQSIDTLSMDTQSIDTQSTISGQNLPSKKRSFSSIEEGEDDDEEEDKKVKRPRSDEQPLSASGEEEAGEKEFDELFLANTIPRARDASTWLRFS